MLFKSTITFLAALASVQLAAGHGAIIKAVGDMGGNGSALGIDGATPRDGSTRNPFQADSTRFKNNNADACGETIGAGPNEPAKQMAKLVKESNGMPMISAGGMVMMTLHQVNGDGAGPYSCMIDSTGTGTGGWTKMEVATNIPGKNSRSKAKATDFVSKHDSLLVAPYQRSAMERALLRTLQAAPFSCATFVSREIAKVAADQTCTGNMAGMSNICMVRCNNAANAGPFGGCVPVQLVATGADASAKANGTTSASASDAAEMKSDKSTKS
ncbi:hypothetical protein HI914_03175 [Erysiphe necator]|nr:hypothetical protein HI914_03175 [Erysiphe necator]